MPFDRLTREIESVISGLCEEMGSIVSVKQRARKKTTALTAFGSYVFAKHQDHGRSIYQGSKGLRSVNEVANDFDEKRTKAMSIDREGYVQGSDVKQAGIQVPVQVHAAKGDGNDMGDLESRREPGLQDVENSVDSKNGDEIQANEIENNVETAILISDSKEKLDRNEELFESNGTNEVDRCHDAADQEHVTNEETHLYHSLSSTPDSLCQGKPRNSKLDTPASNPINQVFGSWGDGVISTEGMPLKEVGHVTSRGLDVAVKSSAELYHDYVFVRSITPQTRNDYADKGKREKAAIKIQSHLRGFQARKEVLQKRQSVLKIQRIYRAHVQKRMSYERLGIPHRRKRRVRSRTPSPSPSLKLEESELTKDSFELYQGDITELKWKSQQLIETATMGDDYEPQKILLISSNMERPEWLARVTLREVHVIMYEFAEVKLKDLLENISLSLADYRVGSKAKRIAFACQGGPGYVYICRGKVLTSKKLQKNRELREFVRQLGDFISKKDPSDTKIHFIGSNVLGNKQGVTLLHDIQKYMHPARVSVESPFEISESGREMLNEYFNIDLYNIWKKSRYSRTKLLEMNGGYV